MGRNPLEVAPRIWGGRGGFTRQVWRGEASPPDCRDQESGVLLPLEEILPQFWLGWLSEERRVASS